MVLVKVDVEHEPTIIECTLVAGVRKTNLAVVYINENPCADMTKGEGGFTSWTGLTPSTPSTPFAFGTETDKIDNLSISNDRLIDSCGKIHEHDIVWYGATAPYQICLESTQCAPFEL